MWENIGTLLWALLVTCVILILAYWFTRYAAGRLGGGKFLRSHGNMAVLDQISLGRDQRLVLVRTGDTVSLLGVTPGGISCLRVLSPEEAAPWLERQPPAEPGGGGTMSFWEALRRTIEQKKQ